MSLVVSPYTIPAVLFKSEEILGPNRVWNPMNEQQSQALELFATVRRELTGIKEIESFVSWKADVLNKILKELMFKIQLDPFKPNEFGVLAILKAIFEWQFKGKARELYTPDMSSAYPGAQMDNDLPIFEVKGFANPIVGIKTKAKDTVYLTVAENAPADEFELIRTIRRLQAGLNKKREMGTHFPMVDLDMQTNLDWLLNMWTVPTIADKAKIVQALRQTKLKMNEKGVRVDEAVAVKMALESMKSQLTINQPFYIWNSRRGLQLPLFTGYITTEHWKNPGKLS